MRRLNGFQAAYGAKNPKRGRHDLLDDVGSGSTCYDYHSRALGDLERRTIEPDLRTVRNRSKIHQGPRIASAGITMAYTELIERPAFTLATPSAASS